MKKRPFDHIPVPWVNPGVMQACFYKTQYTLIQFRLIWGIVSVKFAVHLIFVYLEKLNLYQAKFLFYKVFCSLFLETGSWLFGEAKTRKRDKKQKDQYTKGQWPQGKRIYQQKRRLGIFTVKISNLRIGFSEESISRKSNINPGAYGNWRWWRWILAVVLWSNAL